LCSDVNKDWTHKDKDQSHRDKDLTYKDSKQKRRQALHSFFKTVSLNVFKNTLKYKITYLHSNGKQTIYKCTFVAICQSKIRTLQGLYYKDKDQIHKDKDYTYKDKDLKLVLKDKD